MINKKPNRPSGNDVGFGRPESWQALRKTTDSADIVKAKEAIKTVFFVKNDEAGNLFLAQLHRRLNTGWKMHVRGRNPNRKQFADVKFNDKTGKWEGRHWRAGLRQSLPQKFASYFAVYLTNATLEAKQHGYWRDQYDEANALRAKLNEAHARAISLTSEIDNLRQNLLSMSDDVVCERDAKESSFQTVQRQLIKINDLEEVSWKRVWKMIVMLLNRAWIG